MSSPVMTFDNEAAFVVPHHLTTRAQQQPVMHPLKTMTPFRAQSAFHEEISNNHKDAFRMMRDNHYNDSSSRRSLLLHTATAASAATLLSILVSHPIAPVYAFEGGIGGLGKTKPETGVAFLSNVLPTQDTTTGLVTAEIVLQQEKEQQQQPYLVQFASPSWPLLPTTRGLEVRDLQQPESAFVQIIDQVPLPLTKSVVKKVILTDNILSNQGKFGAYGSPTDLKVTQQEQQGDGNNDLLFTATFTTLTPGLRESDRRILLQCVPVGTNNKNGNTSTVLVLVAGTTLQRFSKQEGKLRALVESLRVTPTPTTRLK